MATPTLQSASVLGMGLSLVYILHISALHTHISTFTTASTVSAFVTALRRTIHLVSLDTSMKLNQSTGI